MSLIAWIFHAHHVASDAEQTLIGNALANAAYVCLAYWLIYLALEPWVRRYWPQTMITWSRVVAGQWSDPLVGRDLLFGTFFGIVYALMIALYEYANLRLGDRFWRIWAAEPKRLPRVRRPYREAALWRGWRLIDIPANAVSGARCSQKAMDRGGGLGCRMGRRPLHAGRFPDTRELAITTGVFWLLLFSLLVFILLRFGFFALVVGIFVLDSLIGCFLTTDFPAWYGQSSFAIAILIVALALRGFRLSLGSRPLFSPAALKRT